MKLIKFILLIAIFSATLIANDNQKISLQLLWKHQFEFAGFYMAKEKGFYKDVGIDLTLKEYKSGIDIQNDVANQKSTFGIAYPNIILNKLLGSKLVLLNSICQTSPHVFITLESSGIKSISDFKNRTLMMEDNVIKTAPLLSMLYSHNVTPKDIKMVKPSFNIKDLINGKADIYSAYLSNEIYQLNKLGVEYKIWDPKDYGFDFYNDILFTSSNLIKKDPKLVANFQEASIKGWKYAFNNIDETIDIILKKYNTQNKTREALKYEATILKTLAFQDNISLGNISEEKVQRIYDVYNLMGLINNKIIKKNYIYKKPIILATLTLEEQKYLQSHKTIKMCNNPNWKPIEFLDNDNMKGIAIDTIKLLEKKLNIKFENIPTSSWSQSQEFLKDKKCDILPAAIKTKKREEYALFTKPYLNYKLAIITKNDKPFVNNIEEIIDKTISRKKGSGLIHKLKLNYPNINIIETKDYTEALQKVSNGDVYCTIATLPVASYYIKLFALNNLQIAGYTNMQYNLSIAVTKNNPVLASILNKSLQSLSKQEQAKISSKWSDTSIKKNIDYSVLWKILFIVIIIIIFFVYKQYMLKKSLSEFNEMINATQEGIIIHKDGVCVDANQSLIDIFGFDSKDDLLNHNILEYVSPESQEIVKKNMLINNVEQYNVTLLKKDGSIFHGLIHGKFIRNNTLRLTGITDITRLKEQERLISEQSKMVQMGEMIGNIAHQWRQPLSVISTSASGMQLEYEMDILDSKKFNSYTDGIIKNTEFLSNTIDTFRDYIKEKKVLKEVILQERLHGAIHIIEATLQNHHINLVNNIDNCKPIKITMVVGELSQVIINLINNAKDVLVQNNISHKIITLNLTQKDSKAIITVEDNGGGISSTVLPKIFNPYFTTKHQSQGTGLGLHMSKEIIEQNLNGSIYATNTKDGVVFTIELPLN